MSRHAHITLILLSLAWLVHPLTAQQPNWSTFEPEEDQRIVYVKEGGTGTKVYEWEPDHTVIGNNPFEPIDDVDAFGSIGDAWSALTNSWPSGGAPGWILLRKGDSWSEVLNINRFGPSSGDGWLLVGAYLDANNPSADRPTLNQITSTVTDSDQVELRRVAIVGLRVLGPTSEAIRVRRNGSDLRIEDVLIPPGNGFGIELQSSHIVQQGITDVIIRGCVIHGRWAPGSPGANDPPGSHRQGIWTALMHGLLIENCVLWKNGWNEPGNANRNQNHNVYLDCSNTDVTFRYNISADASLTGCMQRPGGTNVQNLYLRNPIAVWWGHSECSSSQHAVGTIADNVVLEGEDVVGGDPHGIGVWIVKSGTATEGTTIEDNLFAHQYGGTGARTFEITGSVQKLLVQHNVIYNWTNGPVYQVACGTFSDNVISENHHQQVAGGGHVKFLPANFSGITFDANTYYPTASCSPDPDRFEFDLGVCGIDCESFNNWKSASGESNAVDQEISYDSPERDLGTFLQHAIFDNETNWFNPSTDDAINFFMNRAIQQSNTNWDWRFTARAVNDYMRCGFWGPCPCGAADLDDSGMVDVLDLLALFAAWGECPPSGPCFATQIVPLSAKEQDCLDHYSPGSAELEDCLKQSAGLL